MPIIDLRYLRMGTATDLANSNLVLKLGQPGYELDTGALKIGDGIQAWVSLPYILAGGGAVPDGNKGDMVVTGGGTIWTLDAGLSAVLRARGSHTGTQVSGTISNFSSAVDARIVAASINDLADVTIASPADNQIIKRVAGVWVNAAESGGASSQPPVNLTIADFTSSNLNLTASLYGNRTLIVNVATAVTVTLNNDATGGWTLGDYVDVQAIGVGEVSILQGTATLTTSTGAAADTSTSLSRRVTAQDISASTWRTLTALASAGGGAGSASFAAAGPTGWVLPRMFNSALVDSIGTYGASLLVSGAATARAFADTARGWRVRAGYDTASGLNASAYVATERVFSCATFGAFNVEMISAIADALPSGAGGGRYFLGIESGNNLTINGGSEPTANFEGSRIGLMALSNASQLVLGIAASSGVATTYTLNGGTGFLNDNTTVYSFKVVYQGSGPRKFTWTARNENTGVTVTGVWDGTGGQPALPDTVDNMRAGAKRATVAGATSAVGLDLFGIVFGKGAV